MPEFKSYDDYWQFSRSVIRRSRYLFEPHVEEFLNTVMATIERRVVLVPPSSVLYRAQLGFEWQSQKIDPDDPNSDTIEIEDAFCEQRMKPLLASAREGRINAKGIPCLYLSDDKGTAMAETRPWMGSFISLGDFIVRRELRLVNCCEPRQRFNHIFLEAPHFRVPDPSEREKIAWGEISYAFSEPVAPSDMTAEYVPTQILADFFRQHGYEGVRYKSLLGLGYNYALFDLDAAELYSCQLHEVKGIHFDFDTYGNPYVTMKHYRVSSTSGDEVCADSS